MVKKSSGKGGKKGEKGEKETIKPPTKKELTDASKLLKKGHSSGGRVMADKSVAVREGIVKGKKKPKKR